MARHSCFFLCCYLAILLAVSSNFFVSGQSAIDEKRKEILARRESHKKRINALIKSMRKQLADHSSGEAVMGEKEKQDLERRLALYVQKVDSMKDYVDDEEVETTMAREESQKRHRSNLKEKIIQEAKRLEEEKQRTAGEL